MSVLRTLSILMPLAALAALAPSSRGCLISPSSSLGQTFIATTECPKWVKGTLHALPTAHSHFAFSTGAYRTLDEVNPSFPADWLSLSVSHCGTSISNSDHLTFIRSAPSDTMRLSPIASVRDLLTR